ncbi:MAG: WD40 repeat protein [Akkermansiaceae bacterium]|jgi:WD40 repeat protein
MARPVKTGKVTKEVKMEGITTFNRRASIEDSKHGTYLTWRCKDGSKCFFISAGGDQAEALDEKLELEQGEDLSWTIMVQPKEERWLTFHQSERLTLFERKDGRLVRVQKVESGGSYYGNDDCSNVRFSPEGDRLVIGSDYRTLIIDLETPDKVEKELDNGTYFSDFTSDGEFLVFWDPGGGWPVRTKDWVNLRTETAKKSAFHCCPIETVSVSPDGAMIATTDYQRVLIWAVESGNLLAELTSPRLANDEKCLIHRPAWNMKIGRFMWATATTFLNGRS